MRMTIMEIASRMPFLFAQLLLRSVVNTMRPGRCLGVFLWGRSVVLICGQLQARRHRTVQIVQNFHILPRQHWISLANSEVVVDVARELITAGE